MKQITIVFTSGYTMGISVEDDTAAGGFIEAVKTNSGIMDVSYLTNKGNTPTQLLINFSNVAFIDVRNESSIAVPQKGLIFSNKEVPQA